MIDQAHVDLAMEASLLGGSTPEQRLMTAQDSVVSPTLAFTSGQDLLELALELLEGVVTFLGGTLPPRVFRAAARFIPCHERSNHRRGSGL